MLFEISKLFWLIVQPGNLLVMLLALGVIGTWLGHRRARFLVAAVSATLMAIAVMPLGEWAIMPLEDRFPQPEEPARIDGIVLLGGAVRLAVTRDHRQVALNEFAERITESLALARRHPEAIVLVTGGDPGGAATLTEALATQRLLVALGLDEHRIVLDERARNTYENAVYSKAIAAPRSGQVWVLVTSAFHMPRAVGCFHEVGWDVLPYPVDYQIDAAPSVGFDLIFGLRRLDLAVHEWAGLVSYRLLGRTDALFPGPAPTSSSSAR